MVAKYDYCFITMKTRQLLAKVTADLATRESDQNENKLPELVSSQFPPRNILYPTKMIPCDNKSEEALFRHVLKYGNIMSCKDDHIVPLNYLNHDISTDQMLVVLKLRMADITLEDLMGLEHCDVAEKMFARRRLNMVYVGMNAWNFLINSHYRQGILK